MIWTSQGEDLHDVKSLLHVFRPGLKVKFNVMTIQVFSDWGKEIIPNSQLEKSMAEVAVVNALIVRKGYP